MSSTTQCNECARHRPGSGACSAFPDGIPEDIWTGEFDHALPHKGDNGLRFVQITNNTETNRKYRYPPDGVPTD